ncbi:hypothetical protein Micbo1qcDRAFT_209030 [Microdochium bolleyi]|uniref:Uncharacterized protein n=1 Tax=Microdochium bolleyi TaxID=196109 RepID=A0A136INW5_9PEZI|nr:hypothetical protein Micbo1qcDRAFT_209030 [Microdochium bolleyi]
MKLSKALLLPALLSGAALAVNIHLFGGSSSCSGGGGGPACRSVAQQACCRSSLAVVFRSVLVSEIPEGTELDVYGARDSNCINRIHAPANRTCVGSQGSYFLSGGYTEVGFDPTLPPRPIGGGAAAVRSVAPGDCQEADVLILGDGTNYDIVGLEEKKVYELASSSRIWRHS